MAEKLSLTTPVTPAIPATNDYTVRSLFLGWDEQRIVVIVRDNNGTTTTATWDGAPAVALMLAINKANLTNNSLHKRVLNQLVTDGKLPTGTVTGIPD